MSTYKIERGVPAPVKKFEQFPFADMSVGDSFVVPAREAGCYGKQIMSAFSVWRGRAKRPGYKISLRKTPVGYRVWRIA